MASLHELMRGSPYQSYAYSYPHKMAYRAFAQPRSLRDVWKDEPKDALFLYLHIPFCEMRCGFCNLFTQSHSRAGLKLDLEGAYLATLEREARVLMEALGPAKFSRGAIGGGTPTFFSPEGLRRLLQLFRTLSPDLIPMSVESSPFTATAERLAILKEYGVTRLSVGVQSFVDAEVQASGRAQSSAEVSRALETIRSTAIPELNIDLIYGLPGQTEESWMRSLRAAMQWSPEELYLYPLYVRPLTGLAKGGARGIADAWDELRRACYQCGREFLVAEGYVQLSMRHFRKASLPRDGGDYCCQRDGMAGIGCGARSYTRDLHYSSEYAVGRSGISEIVKEYIDRSDAVFSDVAYGFELNSDERRRRYVIKSILRWDGLDAQDYQELFGTSVRDDIPQLNELTAAGLMEWTGCRMLPTALGMEFSDVIGPWLGSSRVRQSMSHFVLR